MIFVDTSYLIALAYRGDSLHAKAQTLSRTVKGPLLTTDPVIWECVNYFSAPAFRSLAHEIVSSVVTGPEVVLVPTTREVIDKGLRLHLARPDKYWSLTDCISFVVMQEHGISSALTSDHHFEQAGFRRLLV